MPSYYPLIDRPPNAPADWRSRLRAKPTGEFRPPKSGEWYLSGAIVEAYRARNDFGVPFAICTIVEMEQIWVEVSRSARDHEPST